MRSTTDKRDRTLLGQIARGDREAFTRLYERYYQRVFRYVFKITRREELVEETVGDVFFAVWKGASSFEGRSRVSTWIFGTAYRRSLKTLEREGRRWRRERELDPSCRDPRPGPESLMVRREMASLVGRALQALSPDHRSVVELTYFYECSYAEIAEIMGCPVNTVKTRMFHARRKLRRVLPGLGVGDAGELPDGEEQ